MMFVKNYLHKIKWDDRMKPEEYSIVFLDRRKKQEIEVPYNDILEIGDDYIKIEKGDSKGIVEIPFHRIRKIKKAGFVVWKRYGTTEV